MLARIVALVIKELLAILRDPRGRMVLIVPPILQLVIFSLAATLDVKNVSMAVLDQDRGKWSTELAQRFIGSPTFTDIRFLAGVAEIRPVVDAQQAIVVLHIPQGFSGDLAAGRATTLQLILDGRRSNAAQIVQGYVSRIVDQFDRDIASEAGRAGPSSVLVARNWFNPNLEHQWFTVPSLIGTITLLVGMSVTALSIARERELGTFDQLLVSPLQPAEILLGKTLPSLIIGLIHASLFLAAAVAVFRVPFTGSLLLLYASLVIYLLAIIGVGLFISSLSKTQQQAFLGTFVFAAPAILLSGFASPVENMPVWMQQFTLINPLRHFIVIVNGLFTKDMPAATVFDNAWPMALIALFTLSAATWLFRRRLQ